MERKTAQKLFKMYKLEKEYNRGVYPAELRSHGICTKSEIKSFLDTMVKSSSVTESNDNGANVYVLTNIGISNLEAYLDLRREVANL